MFCFIYTRKGGAVTIRICVIQLKALEQEHWLSELMCDRQVGLRAPGYWIRAVRLIHISELGSLQSACISV